MLSQVIPVRYLAVHTCILYGGVHFGKFSLQRNSQIFLFSFRWVLRDCSPFDNQIFPLGCCYLSKCKYHWYTDELWICILLNLIWSNHASSSNRDVETSFEFSDACLRWVQCAKKCNCVAMLSKHTTPENRSSKIALNGTMLTLWCYTFITYSFVFLIFGEQICCQLLTFKPDNYCTFPECKAKPTFQLGTHANKPTNRHTFMYVCNRSAVNTLHIV